MESTSPLLESIPKERPWILFGGGVLISVITIISVRHAALSGQQMPSEVPLSLTAWQNFLMFMIGVLIVFLIIRLIHFSGFIAAVFSAALFLGAWVYCWSLFPWDIALLIASGLTIVQARVRRVFVHDVFVLIGAAGIAINFAFMFTDKSIAMIFACFIIYDMVAGRPNGPVAQMASALVHRGIVPGLIVPASVKTLFAPISSTIHQADSVFLGAGDLILPITLVARASAFGWWQPFVVMLGALIGFAVLGWRKSLKPFPALIPLGFGVCIPYFIIVLFIH